jgi:HPt (histidine-containing phosphotransfer) domain-containing protein
MVEAVFNLEEALARVDHDLEIFQTMAEIFVEQGMQDLAEAQAALAAQDAPALARAAHRLKGAILQFCAPTVFHATKELEDFGKAGNLGAAVAACATLERELRRLLTALRQELEKG